jgi:hypothetical protein
MELKMLKRPVSILLISALLGFNSLPANSQKLVYDPCVYQVPPKRYLEKSPLRLPDYIHYITDMEEMNSICGIPRFETTYGCVIEHMANGNVVRVGMFIFDTGDPVSNACLLKHELAHINGWPSSHPLEKIEFKK